VKKKTLLTLMILTPIFFLLSHAITYLVHEYCHSLTAWIFGYKSNPFDLHYGDASISNLLLLDQVSENVDYDAIEMAHPFIAALVAFSGSFIGNLVLLILSLVALNAESLRHFVWRYFFFWLTVMNIGNFIDYVPVRTFATHGDIHEIVSVLGISPWWIMILLGYPIFYTCWYFYKKILPYSYRELSLNYIAQSILLIITTFTLFVLFGTSGLNGYGEIARFTAFLSLYASPMIIAAFWPKRKIV